MCRYYDYPHSDEYYLLEQEQARHGTDWPPWVMEALHGTDWPAWVMVLFISLCIAHTTYSSHQYATAAL